MSIQMNIQDMLKTLKLCQDKFHQSGLTYDAAAAKCGLAPTTFNSYINAPPKKIRPSTVRCIAEGLGVDASAIPETKEPPENASEMFMLNHCAACRATQEEHNRRLREDFNERHEANRAAYEERIQAINEKHAQRYSDLKERYDERHNMVLEHHKERETKLNETIAELEADNDRLSSRNRVLLITLIILAGVVGILSIIDLSHEGIGWLPHILRLSAGAH